MKKIILLVIILIITTGCSNTVTFDFQQDKIISEIEIYFNQEDFKNFYKDNSSITNYEVIESQIDQTIKDNINGLSLIAYQNQNGELYYYNLDSSNKEGINYDYEYSYIFSYDEFKNNYYLNECFENFTTYENDKYYYYKLNGEFTCNNPENFKLEIKGDKRIAESNSNQIKDNNHYWNISKDNNDIYFVISKTELKGKKFFSTIQIIVLSIIIFLSLISIVLFKKKN